jgi:hypothetical protein
LTAGGCRIKRVRIARIVIANRNSGKTRGTGATAGQWHRRARSRDKTGELCGRVGGIFPQQGR